jgi:hypothetical protein
MTTLSAYYVPERFMSTRRLRYHRRVGTTNKETPWGVSSPVWPCNKHNLDCTAGNRLRNECDLENRRSVEWGSPALKGRLVLVIQHFLFYCYAQRDVFARLAITNALPCFKLSLGSHASCDTRAVEHSLRGPCPESSVRAAECCGYLKETLSAENPP